MNHTPTPGERISSRDLFVLGVVSRGPIHGHGINRIIDVSGAERWVDMSAKHVYYVLRKLQGAGLVEAVEGGPGGGLPRTMYAITGQGRETLRAWLRTPALYETGHASPFDTAFAMLSYADALDEEETLGALHTRRRKVAAALDDHHPGAEQELRARYGAAAASMFRRTRRLLRVELEWIDSVLEEAGTEGWGSFRVPPGVEEGS